MVVQVCLKHMRPQPCPYCARAAAGPDELHPAQDTALLFQQWLAVEFAVGDQLTAGNSDPREVALMRELAAGYRRALVNALVDRGWTKQ